MGFWSGLFKELGYSLAGMSMIAVIAVILHQFVSDPRKIMIFTFIILEVVSFSALAIYFVFRS